MKRREFYFVLDWTCPGKGKGLDAQKNGESSARFSMIEQYPGISSKRIPFFPTYIHQIISS